MEVGCRCDSRPGLPASQHRWCGSEPGEPKHLCGRVLVLWLLPLWALPKAGVKKQALGFRHYRFVHYQKP